MQQVSTRNIFSALLGDRQSLEVNVSKSFAVCFAQSATFRTNVLRLLAGTCGVPPTEFLRCEWICQTEIVRKHGRLDLLLSPSEGRGRHIVLENKVAAPLTKSQMRRYRKGEPDKFVIALTKRHPEPGRSWLEANSCLSVRWQQVHAALAGGDRGRGVDAFLCKSFYEYLEEIDMAYRGDVSLTDLRRIAKLLAVTRAAGQMSEMRARPAFRAALDVLSLLDDVIVESKELLPELSSWSRWGPTYFKWRGGDVDYHHFAFRLKKHGWRGYGGAGFVLPDKPSGRIYLATHISIRGSRDADEKLYYSREWSSRTGAINPNSLARVFVKDVRKSWLV